MVQVIESVHPRRLGLGVIDRILWVKEDCKNAVQGSLDGSTYRCSTSTLIVDVVRGGNVTPTTKVALHSLIRVLKVGMTALRIAFQSVQASTVINTRLTSGAAIVVS